MEHFFTVNKQKLKMQLTVSSSF